MKTINYAVLSNSLPAFETMLRHKFNLALSMGGTGSKCTISTGEVNHVYYFIGSWDDISKIEGEFKLVVINPLTVKNYFTKVAKECARRSRVSMDQIYSMIEHWHHPDSPEGIRQERLKIFKDIGT